MLALSSYAIAWKRATSKPGQNSTASGDLAWTLSMPACLKPPTLRVWPHGFCSCLLQKAGHTSTRDVGTTPPSTEVCTDGLLSSNRQGVCTLKERCQGTFPGELNVWDSSTPRMGLLDGEGHMEIAHPFPLRSCLSGLQKASGSRAIRPKPLNCHAAEEN